jgi:hypothetical protein
LLPQADPTSSAGPLLRQLAALSNPANATCAEWPPPADHMHLSLQDFEVPRCKAASPTARLVATTSSGRTCGNQQDAINHRPSERSEGGWNDWVPNINKGKDAAADQDLKSSVHRGYALLLAERLPTFPKCKAYK